MMLDDYDLSDFGFSEGARHVQVPAGHPVLLELEQGRVRPVGAVREHGWVYLFTIQDWQRVAARQRMQPARTMLPLTRTLEAKARSR